MDYSALMLKQLENHTKTKDIKKVSKNESSITISDILSMLSDEENSL